MASTDKKLKKLIAKKKRELAAEEVDEKAEEYVEQQIKDLKDELKGKLLGVKRHKKYLDNTEKKLKKLSGKLPKLMKKGKVPKSVDDYVDFEFEKGIPKLKDFKKDAIKKLVENSKPWKRVEKMKDYEQKFSKVQKLVKKYLKDVKTKLPATAKIDFSGINDLESKVQKKINKLKKKRLKTLTKYSEESGEDLVEDVLGKRLLKKIKKLEEEGKEYDRKVTDKMHERQRNLKKVMKYGERLKFKRKGIEEEVMHALNDFYSKFDEIKDDEKKLKEYLDVAKSKDPRKIVAYMEAKGKNYTPKSTSSLLSSKMKGRKFKDVQKEIDAVNAYTKVKTTDKLTETVYKTVEEQIGKDKITVPDFIKSGSITDKDKQKAVVGAIKYFKPELLKGVKASSVDTTEEIKKYVGSKKFKKKLKDLGFYKE